MSHLLAMAVVTLFTLCAGVAKAGDNLRDKWLELIRAEVGAGCAVQLVRVATADKLKAMRTVASLLKASMVAAAVFAVGPCPRT
jgi:hypothetical protein